MAPRARIIGGESMDSPMRVEYVDGSSDDEEITGRPTLKQVLKKPSRLLLRKQSSGKMHAAVSSNATRSATSSSGRDSRARSIKITPSVERIPFSRAEDDHDTFGRESPLMETQQMANALPEISQPAPKRMLPRAVLEETMVKPLPVTPPRQCAAQVKAHTPPEPAITALPSLLSRKENSQADEALLPPKRKSSNELAEASTRSVPKAKADTTAADIRTKKTGRGGRPAFKETVVMQWMDGVDNGGPRLPAQHILPVVEPQISISKVSSTGSHFTQHELTQTRPANQTVGSLGIAKPSPKLGSPEVHAPPVPVPERDASARRKRDSSMTATSFTPSIFSRSSTWTDHTFLTTPSEMVAGEVRTKRASRDSRDSWRYTRSFQSPRSSVMSYSSIPYRSRPFKVDDMGNSEDNVSSGPSDAEPASKPKLEHGDARSHDNTSSIRRSFLSADHLNTATARPLSLSPVEENPEIRVTSTTDMNAEQGASPVRDVHHDKTSISVETMNLKGTVSSAAESDDLSRQSGRFRGAFSPGMPREIFGYHTLDFSASSKLSEETAAQMREEDKQGGKGKGKVHSLEHRRSVSSDVLNAPRTGAPLFADIAEEAAPTIIRKDITAPSTAPTSEASLSPTISEFGEGSSGITDYTDDDLIFLSDFPGIGRPLQMAIANIRRDVVNRVMHELHGVTTAGHDGNTYGNESGQAYHSQGSSSTPINGQAGSSGNNGASKRPSRDSRGEDSFDREDGDPGKRRKLNAGTMHTSIMRSRFACPFYKRNADCHQRWRSCKGPGWEEVRRVKEHVYRRHMLFTCPRCLQSFDEKALLENHAQSDVSCNKATTPPPQDMEGCTQDQERKLRCRKRPPGETDEDRWAEMYRILFGDESDVPSPYYDFDLPTASPSPSDLPLIEDTLRQLPQRLAADIGRRLRRPLEEDERDALPEIIRTSLQAVMPPFWRMFAATPGSDTRAPPASDQGDSAYGSAEHDRESSAPPRPYHAPQTSQTTFSQIQTPSQTPNQNQSGTQHFKPPPSRDLSFSQNVDYISNAQGTWPQNNSSYVTMAQMPSTLAYAQTYHHTHTPMTGEQHSFAPVRTTNDPIVHDDFGDLLIPNAPYMSEAEQKPALRWSFPQNLPDSSGADLPALPLHSIPFCMPPEQQQLEQQHSQSHQMHHNMSGFHSGVSPTPTPTTVGPSPNFQQYMDTSHFMTPQPKQHPHQHQQHHNYQRPQQQANSSMSYHENTGTIRDTSHRNSVNLLTTTDQIDNWMWGLTNGNGGTSAAGSLPIAPTGASGPMHDVFGVGNNGNMHHHSHPNSYTQSLQNLGGMMGMMKVKGKKRRPEVEYTHA